jgi:hypothetical protein
VSERLSDSGKAIGVGDGRRAVVIESEGLEPPEEFDATRELRVVARGVRQTFEELDEGVEGHTLLLSESTDRCREASISRFFDELAGETRLPHADLASKQDDLGCSAYGLLESIDEPSPLRATTDQGARRSGDVEVDSRCVIVQEARERRPTDVDVSCVSNNLIQVRLLEQDVLLELHELRSVVRFARVQPLPKASRHSERIGLPVGPVEREYQLAAQSCSTRLSLDKFLELRAQLGVTPEREIGVDPCLEGAHARLFESGRLLARKRLLREVAQRVTPPQSKAGPEFRGRLGVLTSLQRCESLLVPIEEFGGIELIRRDAQHIAGTFGRQPTLRRARPSRRAKELPQPHDSFREPCARIPIFTVWPDRVAQLRARHELVRTRSEQGENTRLVRTSQLDGLPADHDFEWAQDPNLHVSSVDPLV